MDRCFLLNLLVTPQRMRMIVHSIEESLDKGLKKDGQVVPMSQSPSCDISVTLKYIVPTFVFGVSPSAIYLWSPSVPHS